jgi:hypothetical protein
MTNEMAEAVVATVLSQLEGDKNADRVVEIAMTTFM